MLTLSRQGLNQGDWSKAEIALPSYDLDSVAKNTEVHPQWLHFGTGNIFRIFIAGLQNQLLNENRADTGIIAVEGYDYEIIDKIYKPYDNLTLSVMMGSDGKLRKQVVSSVTRALKCGAEEKEDWQSIKQVFVNPNLKLVSFTITEKGYALKDGQGNYGIAAQQDLDKGPGRCHHIMGMVVSLLYNRYLQGEHPLALVSMDNCSKNGDVLKKAVLTIAEAWATSGFIKKSFLNYINDESKITFPWTMIDKITPRPSKQIKAELDRYVEDMDIIRTQKQTFIAPYVNAEVPQYLVIEDSFPNGRPPLEYGGVLFTNREMVEKAERMKVNTCLNPLHTALAIFGCLLGYDTIADEMRNSFLVQLVRGIGCKEGMPVVTNPGILNPETFIDEVIQERLPNPYLPDTPQRIATDTSQKLAIRFGETLKAYRNSPHLNTDQLVYIPLTIAGWCRYLLAIDDMGNPFELSPDPMAKELQSFLSGIEIGNQGSAHRQLVPLLSNTAIFGVNLYEEGIGEKVELFFGEMIASLGAVEQTLKKYIKGCV